MLFKPFARAAMPLVLGLSAVVEGASQNSRAVHAMKKYMESGPTGSSSSNVYKTGFEGVTWDEDNWVLSTCNLEQGRFQTRGSIANGYLGINVASVGPFFEIDQLEDGGDVIQGWPLYHRRQSFATIAGFFDYQHLTDDANFYWLSQYGGESVISGIPHWAGLVLDLGDGNYLDATVDGTTISNFESSYDFKAGVLSWSYEWTPAGNKGSFQITYRMFTNKLYVNQAVVDMEVTSTTDTSATIVNLLDGTAAVRTDFVDSGEDAGALFSAVRPNGVSNVTAYIYANMVGSHGAHGADMSSRKVVTGKPYISGNDSTIAQSMDVHLKAGKAVQVTKYVGAASTDAFADPQQVAKDAAFTATKNGFVKGLRSHITEWQTVMPDSSVDSYAYNGNLPDDQYIIDSAVISVANTYYLLQNTVSQNAIKEAGTDKVNVDSISVGGLTSDSYAGLVFWDADVWMQPGLTTSHPEAAQRVTNYRLEKYGQAKANMQTAFASSKNETDFSPEAAVFPWTSGRYGNCTATGPCFDYQYHLNGDIGLSMIYRWVTSGDTESFKESMYPVYNSVATLFADILVRNESSSTWTLLNMTDPDEYANMIDAGGFTMPMIAETLDYANTFREQFGIEQNETWKEMADNVLVLRENGVTLEYTTMNGSGVVKQADVVLDTYPLDYNKNYSPQDALNDLDYYASKQSPDGPAMTWAIFSIVANEMSPSGCSAYTYGQYSYLPYTRAPFFQMGEQLIDNPDLNGGTHPAYPFLTGHGGSNQVGVAGYLGLRMHPDDYLHIDPNLPPQIPYLSYRTFYWRGWPIAAWSNYTHTTLARDSEAAPLPTADQRFANQAIAVQSGSDSDYKTYQLPVTGSLVVPNRQIGSKNTVPGNLVQCRPVDSPDSFEPGQFPIAAVDGATSTKWQPVSAHDLSSVTVSFGEEVGSLVSGFAFDWAQQPPVNATVIFHNKTIADPAMAYKTNQNSDYQVVSALTNIKQSEPYTAETNLDIIMIPKSNTTNVNLDHPVPASKYASLLIVGNQAWGGPGADPEEVVGATVAEWAIIGQGHNQTAPHSRRQMNVRAAAALSESGSFMQRRRQAIPAY